MGKRLLPILGAVVLLVLMALLPLVLGLLQDRATLWVPFSGELQSVELDFEREIPGLGLMALSAYGRNWTMVDPSNATMTLEEAAQNAQAALESYRKAGLLDDQAVMGIRYIAPTAVSIPLGNLTGIIWEIALVSDKKAGKSVEVFLNMDDATGRISRFELSTEVPSSLAEKERLLDTFARIFFGQLGIEDYDWARVEGSEMDYSDENTAIRHYRFADSQYGEVSVDLLVHPYGLYVTYTG